MAKISEPTAKHKRNLHPRDRKRAASHLLSRATWLERRREPDPRCRAAQLDDAADCARLARLLLEEKK